MAAYTTIDDPSAFFQCTLYAGNNGTQTITHGGNSDLQANFIWGKARNDTAHSFIIDSIRGVAQRLRSSGDEKQATVSTGITAIGSDSFAVGNDGDFNDTGINYVTWNWKAGTALDNSAGTNGGSIATTGSINTTSGFGIIKYVGTGSNATIYHGLGKIPRMIITKNIDQTFHWSVYTFHSNTKILRLNGTNAEATETAFQSTDPTTTIQSLGNHNQNNGNGDTHISYMFCDVPGYQKIGLYTGNGNADGTFVYTGFKPAFVMIKASAAVKNWEMFDNKREGFNQSNDTIYANAADAEGAAGRCNLLSNGFKLTTGSTHLNASGGTFIYLAIAENPFVTSTGVPATAR